MRRLDLGFGLVAVAGLAGALWTWQQLNAERQRSAGLQHRASELQAALATKARADVEKPPIPAAPMAAAPPEKAGPPGTTIAYLTEEESQELATRRLIAAQMRKAAQREREMLRDPAYRQSQHDEMKRRFAPLRADAIRAGMTPQQADRVVDIELEHIARFSELGGATGQPPTAAVQAELARATEAAQAELRQLLGEELYTKWNRYRASVQERAEVGQWRAQLSEPINDKQADALAESLYTERERRSREYEDYVKSAGITDRNVVAPADRQRWLDLEKEANQRTHDAMSTTLSPDQLASLDAMLAGRLVPIEAALRLQLEGKLAKQD